MGSELDISCIHYIIMISIIIESGLYDSISKSSNIRPRTILYLILDSEIFLTCLCSGGSRDIFKRQFWTFVLYHYLFFFGSTHRHRWTSCYTTHHSCFGISGNHLKFLWISDITIYQGISFLYYMNTKLKELSVLHPCRNLHHQLTTTGQCFLFRLFSYWIRPKCSWTIRCPSIVTCKRRC